MTPELEALARRAVACRGWQWMPGMSTHLGVRVARINEDQYALGWYPNGHLSYVARIAIPDLTDPATLGCLLALVREAWNNPDLLVQRDGILFVVNPTPKGSPLYGDLDGPSEAAVLVAALEAAP